ncbi:hypothetical protein Ahy_A01g002247 [Arachis hypogaea]|uniref:Uncharacterized protein n=1 Tax=Arachis hypogaea TaxID=3818 RepID=A0A445EQN5_ARAHY|nr:hypothetical protein Ahy_A01g002247 [Arachis hypogaea]
MHGSLVTSSLIRETTENESANEGYRFGQEEETYNIVAAHAAMVKLVDTLLLGSSARASRFESEWRHGIFYSKRHKNDLSAIIAPSVIFTQGFATSGLSLFNNSIVGVIEQYGLMRHGDHIGIGIPRKLGPLLLGPYLRFIYILEKIRNSKV